jgi:hypothetical protein
LHGRSCAGPPRSGQRSESTPRPTAGLAAGVEVGKQQKRERRDVERRMSEGMAADAQLDLKFIHVRADEGAMGVVLIEAASLLHPGLQFF